jgi:hypothetical protein
MIDELRRQWADAIADKGGHCPVCDRWGKIYPRNINKTMCSSLIWLAHFPHGTWVDVPMTGPKWLVRSNQLPTLRWWNLVERKSNDEETRSKFSGMWRVTSRGRDFLDRKITIPKKVFTYNGEPVGFSVEQVTIDDCAGDFVYSDVMSETFKTEETV